MSDDELRVGLLSDVHANRVALNAVLADMPPVDALVHAGDVIGYGPSPNECIETLRRHDTKSVRGNHDEALFDGPAYESGDRYAIRTIDNENYAWLENCPAERVLFDGRVKVIHGNPHERFQYTFPADFDPRLLGTEDFLVLGHTHIQSKAAYEDGIIVNPGSVGQPRDGNERAAYAVLDFETGTVKLHRVAYDTDRVGERIEQTAIADKNASRLTRGR